MAAQQRYDAAFQQRVGFGKHQVLGSGELAGAGGQGRDVRRLEVPLRDLLGSGVVVVEVQQ